MQDLFDMFAGTSTGSILSTGLSTAYNPKDPAKRQPMFWSKKVKDIYVNERDVIFKQNGLGVFAQFITYLICFILFAIMFFFCGKRKYNNPKKKEAYVRLIEYLQT